MRAEVPDYDQKCDHRGHQETQHTDFGHSSEIGQFWRKNKQTRERFFKNFEKKSILRGPFQKVFKHLEKGLILPSSFPHSSQSQ